MGISAQTTENLGISAEMLHFVQHDILSTLGCDVCVLSRGGLKTRPYSDICCVYFNVHILNPTNLLLPEGRRSGMRGKPLTSLIPLLRSLSWSPLLPKGDTLGEVRLFPYYEN